MARVFLDKYNGSPLFSPEATVGIGMTNEMTDVCLVQLFLKAILQSQKTFLAGDTVFTPPDGGGTLEVSGVWDEASKRWLARWETLLSEARGYWAYGKNPTTLFPGTVVPYRQGGKKIIAMNEMATVMFGKDDFVKLNLPGGKLPVEAWKRLFYDPVYGP